MARSLTVGQKVSKFRDPAFVRADDSVLPQTMDPAIFVLAEAIQIGNPVVQVASLDTVTLSVYRWTRLLLARLSW